jgi:flagellar hook-associated protein 1 FlgK
VSLTVAFNNARSSLIATAKQISISGRNIAGADDPSYTRKIAERTTDPSGGAHVVAIARATDPGIFSRVLSAKASTGQHQAILDGLARLHETVGDTADPRSPAARLGALVNALQAQANAPSNRSLAQATMSAAEDVAITLHAASQAVLTVRNEADAAIAVALDRINNMLAEFGRLNSEIVRLTVTGGDATDAMDRRDAILGQLSQEIGISTVTRENNEMAIYTDSGVPLFDKSPRLIQFTTNAPLVSGAVGNAVVIDGVPVTGESATMPLRSGRLAGLAALRDEVAVAFQSQLDEIARGLIEAFAESDQSGGGGPDLAGLFTWSGGPAVPASGIAVAGLAASILVNPAVIPALGGSLDRIRDGGINGAAYSYNPTGATSFQARLQGLVDAMAGARAFDPSAGLQSNLALSDYALASVGWVEEQRRTASTTVEYQTTLLARASEALSNATGVNMDDEYAIQLQLEQSYAASSKLINILKQIFETLLAATA